MAKLDFSNSEDVRKLKNELDNILEERLHKIDLDSVLNALNEQSFGAIKDVFESVTDKLYETKEGKKIIAKYVKAVREGKNTFDAYTINEFVRKAPHVSNPEKFLTEAISMTGDFNKNAFKEEKKKVSSVVEEAIRFAGVDSAWVNENINRNYAINNSIDYLITHKANMGNLAEYVNNFETVKEHLIKNMREEISEDADKSGRELIDELNESLSGLKDWERDAIKKISIAKLSKSDFSKLFEEYKEECRKKLSESIENEGVSTEMKSKFQSMAQRLDEKKYNEDSVYEDILTLAELKATLDE